MNDQPHINPSHPARHPLGRQRAWQIAALLLATLVSGIGCDPISTLSYFLLPFSDNNMPCECTLTLPDKESTVVFICNHKDSGVIGLRLTNADYDICKQLVPLLNDRYKENGDKVKIVPVSKAFDYLRKHPDWITMSKQELGKKFNADFVVYLELGPMTIWQEGSRQTLYLGKAEIHMTVIDVSQPEGESVKWDKFYNCSSYPSTGPVDAMDCSPDNFQTKFMEHIARDLMPYFAAHPQKERADWN